MASNPDDQSQSRSGLRVGIAGFGLAGQVFHAPLIHATPGLAVSGIVTGDPGRIRDARQSYPEAEVVPSVEGLWDSIDLLVVATPNRFHAELALEAIGRGVPVIVDKPLAASVEDARKVVEAGGKLTVFQNRRWDGDFLTIKALLDEGRLGQPLRFVSRFERFRPVVADRWRESGDPADGGGQLADLGPHLVDQAVQLFGPPSRLYAEVDRRRQSAEADDDVFIAMEHEGGVRSHIHLGVLAPVPAPRFTLTGQAGGLVIEGLDPQEAQLKDGMLPSSQEFGARPPGRLHPGPGAEAEEVPLKRGAYLDFYSGIPAWVDGEEPAPVDPSESLEVLEIIDKARDSAESHVVIDY